MKKNIFYIFLVITLFLTGCGDKSQALDPTKDEKVEQVADKADKPEETKKEQEADLTIPDKKIEEEHVVEADEEEEQKTKEEQAKVDNIEKEAIYFDFDKFNIRADMQPVVEDVSSLIKKRYAEKAIFIEGNCDEWGTDEYNYALGLKRAKTVKDTLVGLGANKEMFKLKSYGESNPICSEKNDKCWSANRRVEFKIIK